MRRLIVCAALVALAVVPGLAAADHVLQPGECAGGDILFSVMVVPGRPGSGHACVSDGDASNGNELYVGGDVTQQCGRVEVAGNVLADSGEPEGDPNTYCD